MGIEYAQDKYEVSVQAKADYEKKYGAEPLLDLVNLYQQDVTQMKNLEPATHIYSYNPVWKGELMDKLVKKIKQTTTAKVVVWALPLADTRRYGLVNARLVK